MSKHSLIASTCPYSNNRGFRNKKLKQYINDVAIHSTQCRGTVVSTGEVRDGLVSVMLSHCSTCNHTFTMEAAHKVKRALMVLSVGV